VLANPNCPGIVPIRAACAARSLLAASARRWAAAALVVALAGGRVGAEELTIGRHPEYTRLVLRTAKTPQYDVVAAAGSVRIQIFRDGLNLPFQQRVIDDPIVQSLRIQNGRFTGQIEVTVGPEFERYEAFALESPPRLVVDFYRRTAPDSAPATPPPGAAPARAVERLPALQPAPASASERPIHVGEGLVPSRESGPMPEPLPPAEPEPGAAAPPEAQRVAARAGTRTGVQRVVLDPGHGGSEIGARGPGGTFEKDICLAIARRLQRRLENELGLEVILTRDRDIEVPLTYRAEVANNRQADLFISIHANAFHGRNISGAETYFLSDSGVDEETRALVALENNTMGLSNAGAPGGDEISMLLWELANKEYLRESRDLADVIQRNFNQALSLPDRGVKQGRFLVLKGATMPAVLVEVGFISNPAEERKLLSSSYQQKLADALFESILEYKQRVDRYSGSLSQASGR